LLIAVGDAVIDTVPGGVERAAVAVLGHADKPVLLAAVLAGSALLGAGLGRLGRRRFDLAAAGFVLAAAVGVIAGLVDARSSVPATVVVGLVGAVSGVLVLHRLLRLAGPAPRSTTQPVEEDARVPGVGRRRFLAVAVGTGALAVSAGVAGWWITGRDRLDDLRRTIRLPEPLRRAAPPPVAADLEIGGLTPLFTPNKDFYRIDTALRVPVVDLGRWRLEVRGRVERPFSLSYAELMELPQVEADVTLVCVSNEVGGDLVGNARWQGVPLTGLLERAGLQDDAAQILGRSVDGFSAGFPTQIGLGEPEAMVAVAMNGEPLPVEHGFPARLVVPGLYGYVSATKWLSAIELTGWDVEGYWIPRGWAKEGPVKTQTRIDVPAFSTVLAAGRRTPIAGVAWAPGRGIERVEVRIDDGPWLPADLAAPLDVDCWRQWHLTWQPTPGVHRITARATDGLGEVQSAVRTSVDPDGASGYPFRMVRAEA
jgi:DMSO/TMAO reductase YedYZ molybdopterin-dependent catalytic subunit